MRAGRGGARASEGAGGEDAENPVWVVIREDENGNRYRVGRYPTREEAQGVCDAFESHGHRQLYVIEKIPRSEAS